MWARSSLLCTVDCMHFFAAAIIYYIGRYTCMAMHYTVCRWVQKINNLKFDLKCETWMVLKSFANSWKMKLNLICIKHWIRASICTTFNSEKCLYYILRDILTMKLSSIKAGYNVYLVPGIKNDTTTFYYMVPETLPWRRILWYDPKNEVNPSYHHHQ